VEPKEAVGEDSTVEKGAEFTLDEARYAPLLNTCIAEPIFQMVLDHAVEHRRLRTARDIFGDPSRVSRLSHLEIVVLEPGRGRQDEGIEVPATQRLAIVLEHHNTRTSWCQRATVNVSNACAVPSLDAPPSFFLAV
jgi:hypothetical protein